MTSGETTATGQPPAADGEQSSAWALPDFRAFWVGNGISEFGSQITLLALPLLAVTVLNASGTEVGILQALYTLPFFLCPLPVGLWLDQRTRRPIMVAMDLGRCALVASVPITAWLSDVSLRQLFVVALVGGAMTVVHDIATQAYVPALVGPSRLASANSRLSANLAVGATAGPGLAGWLSSAVGAATTLLIDAVSYLMSAATLLLIKASETPPVRTAERDLRREVIDGLKTVFANPPIRAIAIHASIYNAGSQLGFVGFVVYLLRDVDASPGLYGLTLVIGGLGAVVGTLAAPVVIRRLGYGRAMLLGVAFSTNAFFVPLGTSERSVVILASLGFFLGSAGSGIGSVVAATVRQLLTPAALHARMNASYRLMSFGMIPIGAAVAGLLVDAVGARTTLWIAPFVLLVSAISITSAAVRTLHRIPAPAS